MQLHDKDQDTFLSKADLGVEGAFRESKNFLETSRL